MKEKTMKGLCKYIIPAILFLMVSCAPKNLPNWADMTGGQLSREDLEILTAIEKASHNPDIVVYGQIVREGESSKEKARQIGLDLGLDKLGGPAISMSVGIRSDSYVNVSYVVWGTDKRIDAQNMRHLRPKLGSVLSWIKRLPQQIHHP
jgi:hypothetical protein